MHYYRRTRFSLLAENRRLRARVAVLQAQQASHGRLDQLNAELSYSRDLLRTVFDSVSDGLALLGRDGTVLAANLALARFHVTTPDGLVGKNVCASGSPVGVLAAQAIADGCARFERRELRTSQGELRIFDLQAIPLCGPCGKVDRVVLHITDQTEHTRLEALTVQNEQLAASSRLAALIAHELNTPLQAVQNNLYLLDDNQEREQALQQIHNELDRVGLIVRRLLEFQHNGSQEPAPIAVNELIERVLLLTGSRLYRQRVTIVRNLAPKLPPLTGRADQFTLVLLNLILRAAEHMPDGGTLVIRTQLWAGEPENSSPMLLIELCDTGVAGQGAPLPEGPYYNIEAAGSELRMEICRGIMRQHSGTMQLWNAPDRGHVALLLVPLTSTALR